MFGTVSGFSYTPHYSNYNSQAATAQAASHTSQIGNHPSTPAESAALPVQPVSPTREVISNDSKFSIESLLNQHGSDPVAMAARMRIQQPEQFNQIDAANQSSDLDVEKDPLSASEDAKSPQEILEEEECQTCENRKYQDDSDDPGVSFKTATKLSPDQAATAVRGHEMEHVVREQAKASREDRRVISQSVMIQTAICPECGTVYASGGTTTTVTKANPVKNEPDQAAEEPDRFSAVA